MNTSLKLGHYFYTNLLGRKQSQPTSRHYHGICFEKLRKITKSSVGMLVMTCEILSHVKHHLRVVIRPPNLSLTCDTVQYLCRDIFLTFDRVPLLLKLTWYTDDTSTTEHAHSIIKYIPIVSRSTFSTQTFPKGPVSFCSFSIIFWNVSCAGVEPHTTKTLWPLCMEYIFKTNHIRLTFDNLHTFPLPNCLWRLWRLWRPKNAHASHSTERRETSPETLR